MQVVGRHFRPPLTVDTSPGALPALACRFGAVAVQGTVGSDAPVVATLAASLSVPPPQRDENGTACSHAAGTHATPCAVWCYSPEHTVGTVPLELTVNGQVAGLHPCTLYRAHPNPNPNPNPDPDPNPNPNPNQGLQHERRAMAPVRRATPTLTPRQP